MRGSVLLAIVALATTETSNGQGRRGADKPPPNAEAWTYRATKGEMVRGGELRIYDKKVWYKDELVGSLAVKGDEALLILYATQTLNGRAVVKRDPKDSTVWRGVLQHADRSKWQLVLTSTAETPKEKKKK